ncbi:hypothetical protein [Streptomyces olivaceiscleroticus]|uniref:Transposase n=1 Tax=Streptomyces olivaceiscleroticus TaxID=68245 RepID=A0ABP3JFJ9_9ACTN
MSGARRGGRPRVEVGAHVRFRGTRWQVVGLAGPSFHLAREDGGEEVVLAGYLFADSGFAVLGAGAEQPQAVPRWGLFETAPAAAREKALAWQRHIREVECGWPDGSDGSAMVREQYDSGRWTLAEREQAKAEELTALGFGRVSRTTVQRMRLAYRKQGLWGLVGHRTTRSPSPTGRADERVVAAVREALRRRRGRAKGTINGLFPLINQILQDRHGPGTVPAPSQATLYRLVTALARPGELPTGPVRVKSTGTATERGEEISAFALRRVNLSRVPVNRLSTLARYGQLSKAQSIERAPEPRRTALLTAVVRQLEAQASMTRWTGRGADGAPADQPRAAGVGP